MKTYGKLGPLDYDDIEIGSKNENSIFKALRAVNQFVVPFWEVDTIKDKDKENEF